jgi:hypothetical protein
MSRKAFAFLVLGPLLLGCTVWAQRPPRDEEVNLRPELLHARAVLEIKSEAGVCLWTISGDDDLVRLPVEDERFAFILLSTRFEGTDLRLTVAGEKAPLQTTPLGQVDLSFDAAPVAVSSFRAVKSRSDSSSEPGREPTLRGWELRLLHLWPKVDTSNCCHCPIQKLACCPNPNYCMGCGVCGNCCGD